MIREHPAVAQPRQCSIAQRRSVVQRRGCGHRRQSFRRPGERGRPILSGFTQARALTKLVRSLSGQRSAGILALKITGLPFTLAAREALSLVSATPRSICSTESQSLTRASILPPPPPAPRRASSRGPRGQDDGRGAPVRGVRASLDEPPDSPRAVTWRVTVERIQAQGVGQSLGAHRAPAPRACAWPDSRPGPPARRSNSAAERLEVTDELHQLQLDDRRWVELACSPGRLSIEPSPLRGSCIIWRSIMHDTCIADGGGSRWSLSWHWRLRWSTL